MFHRTSILAAALIGAASLLPMAAAGEGMHDHAAHHAAAPDTEKYPALPKPGQKVQLEDGRYFTYGFDKKPKLGTAIMKVQVFTKDGKRDTTCTIKGDADMPSMRGAHGTGFQPFSVSKKGDYLLPVNLVMPGEWEIRFLFLTEGKPVFRGSHVFSL